MRGCATSCPRPRHFLNHLEPIVARVLEQDRTERELDESRIVAREHETRRRELEHEVAQRKRAELALRDAEEYLRLMVESVRDFALFTVDRDGRVVSWNPGAEQLFGYAEAEILGRDFDILYTPEDRAGGVPEQEIATAAATGRSSDERWHQRKDGNRFFASGVISPRSSTTRTASAVLPRSPATSPSARSPRKKCARPRSG